MKPLWMKLAVGLVFATMVLSSSAVHADSEQQAQASVQ